MRSTRCRQLPLAYTWGKNERAVELERIYDVLSRLSFDDVMADICGDRSRKNGRPGMSASQVVHCMFLKTRFNLTFDELEFHLADSSAFRRFAALAFGEFVSASALQDNLTKVKASTWKALWSQLAQRAVDAGVDDAMQVRADCTVTESNIHAPTDSSLLHDAVVVLTRVCRRAVDAFPMLALEFPNRLRMAKRRAQAIQFASRKKSRLQPYKDLLSTTEELIGAASIIRSTLKDAGFEHADDVIQSAEIVAVLDKFLPRASQVVQQTRRRVVEGESVPSAEKLVSIFEEHTDVIVKGSRDVEFGHKVLLTTGRSQLVLDCEVLDGNPMDATLVSALLARLKTRFGAVPKAAAFDGGFASNANVDLALDMGVVSPVFHKKRGIPVEKMAASPKMFTMLKNFRAGIEANISRLKHCFGLKRCRRRGREGFHAHVHAGVLAYNLVVIAAALP